MDQELEQILTKLKDTNALIDPDVVVRLIEEVGGWIDDLDLEIIEAEQASNNVWVRAELQNPNWTKAKIAIMQKASNEYQNYRQRLALLRRLRRHYRLLNTKLQLLTKPKGR